MDTFLEFAKEVLKGMLRAISAHLFRKTFLNKEKTTQRRNKQKGGSQKQPYFDNHPPVRLRLQGGKFQLLSFLIYIHYI